MNDYLIIPNSNPTLRALLVLHGDDGPEPDEFLIAAWRVCHRTGSNIPVLAGGLQIGEGESLENWATFSTDQPSRVYPLETDGYPTSREAFLARNAPQD